MPRSIHGVEAVLFFKEMEPDVFPGRHPLQGRPPTPRRIAEHFGGGGHAHAAGFTVYGPATSELIRGVPANVARLLSGWVRPGARPRRERWTA